MFQMLTQLGVVYVIEYPAVYKSFLRYLDAVTNINLLAQSPISCSVDVNFYTTLVVRPCIQHIVVPVRVHTRSCVHRCIPSCRWRRCSC